MAALSDYLESALLNAVLRNSAYSSPATVYLALYTSDPTDADTGSEVSGGSYARQAVTFAAPSGGSCSNSAAVAFPTATASWGTITHVGIRDAAAAGNLLWHGSVTSVAIGNGDTATVSAGSLVVSLG